MVDGKLFSVRDTPRIPGVGFTRYSDVSMPTETAWTVREH